MEASNSNKLLLRQVKEVGVAEANCLALKLQDEGLTKFGNKREKYKTTRLTRVVSMRKVRKNDYMDLRGFRDTLILQMSLGKSKAVRKTGIPCLKLDFKLLQNEAETNSRRNVNKSYKKSTRLICTKFALFLKRRGENEAASSRSLLE